MTDYTHLSMRERCKLASFMDMELSMSEIAKCLGRHRSTLYLGLTRNHTHGHYRPGLVHHKMEKQRPKKALKL